MKIAIAHPHPIPFALGGAENLFWGLQKNIEELSDRSCDLVTMLSPENSLWDIVSSYRAFSQKDLSGYDLVISGKYPAWMVRHPNHVCYLLHRLRGLYDTYPSTPKRDSEQALHPAAVELMSWMLQVRATGLGPSQCDALLDRLAALRNRDLDAQTIAFPGKFARAVVHFLDDCALNAGQIQRFATLSSTVRRRTGYFPSSAPVDVLYPPPHRSDYFCAGDDYFFTSSRLDGPKRVDLLIAAMQHVQADIPLLIAGTGPHETQLRDLAAGDNRIKFLGFVDDALMPGLYANALAVPFVPQLEDYGLITLEAMRSAKPVITVSDAGGPCELVKGGETGFVTVPNPEALGERLQYLCDHRDEARSMGKTAQQSVSQITWANLIAGLVGQTEPSRRPTVSRKKKITVATTFPIWPPRGGGQARVFHLYRNLARHYDVEIVSVAAPDHPDFDAEIAPGLREIRIAKRADHDQGERTYRASVGEIALTDLSMPTLSRLTPRYREALNASAVASFAIVACHPYQVDEIRNAALGKQLWYEAQDVEYTLKQVLLKDRGPMAELLLNDVARVEQACWREADFVFACAERDLGQLQSLYGPTRARLATVPNGVALEETSFVGIAERRRRKQELGFTGPVALFMGSWHGPNIESVRHIFDYAAQLPAVTFLVMGSAGRAVANDSFPSNVKLLGEVDVPTRQALLATTDVALNPTFSGSGTNVKMLDYFGAGIPVVSTRFGARGIDAVDGVHATLTDGDGFVDGLKVAIGMSDEQASAIVSNARRLVEERYSWESIAEGLNDIIVQHWPV